MTHLFSDRQETNLAEKRNGIDEVLDGLRIEKACLAGLSPGGCPAFHFKIRQPRRAARVVLIDPAASFEGMNATFLWHSFPPFMVHSTREGLIKYFRWMIQGILNTRPQPPIRASAFSDEDLRRVRVPTLPLIGGRSEIDNPRRVFRRATRLTPGMRAEIIPDSSH